MGELLLQRVLVVSVGTCLPLVSSGAGGREVGGVYHIHPGSRLECGLLLAFVLVCLEGHKSTQMVVSSSHSLGECFLEHEIFVSGVRGGLLVLAGAFFLDALLPAKMVGLMVGREVGHQIKFITLPLLIWKRLNLQDTCEPSIPETASSCTPPSLLLQPRATASTSPMCRRLTWAPSSAQKIPSPSRPDNS